MTRHEYDKLQRGYYSDEEREELLDAAAQCFECGDLLLDEEVVHVEGEVFCEAHAPM